jgi:hypothetical protein
VNGIVDLAMPSDFLRAMNMMEMSAYAVHTDFASRLAGEAGDPGAYAALSASHGFLCDIYNQVVTMDGFEFIEYADKRVTDCGQGLMMLPHCKRDFAMAAAGYRWYWDGMIPATKNSTRYAYNDPLINMLEARCVFKSASYFALLAEGAIKPRFVNLERADIVRLGEGYRSNPLDMPGFEDVSSPCYREFSAMNTERLKKIEYALGLG